MVGVGERIMNFEKGDLVEVRFFRKGKHPHTKAICLSVHSIIGEVFVNVLPIGEEKPLTLHHGRCRLIPREQEGRE
jgi:hypothetical protein